MRRLKFRQGLPKVVALNFDLFLLFADGVVQGLQLPVGPLLLLVVLEQYAGYGHYQQHQTQQRINLDVTFETAFFGLQHQHALLFLDQGGLNLVDLRLPEQTVAGSQHDRLVLVGTVGLI